VAGSVSLIGGGAGWFVWREAPGWAAAALLHPSRHRIDARLVETTGTRRTETFTGDGVRLAGWRFAAHGQHRGTVVYLHGVADNRGSSIAPGERLAAQGFDVIAYDSRAHGDSDGDVCTYGYDEKRDLERVLDAVGAAGSPIVVIGSSLGAAVALQAAAEDKRISAVVAAESFSDLRTVATERAPAYLPRAIVRRAFAAAEAQGRFEIDAVSPVAAAARISVPVMIIHGALDHDTVPDHSRRIYDALTGPRRFLMVERAGHNQSLTESTWLAIEQWMEEVVMERNR